MKFTHPQIAWDYLRRVMREEVEEFWALALSPDKHLLSADCLFRGTVDACMLHPRDIFRFALLHNASSLLIAHNHPSQNLRPSSQDLQTHKALLQASEFLQIPIDDHLIIGKRSYTSFLEEKLM